LQISEAHNKLFTVALFIDGDTHLLYEKTELLNFRDCLRSAYIPDSPQRINSRLFHRRVARLRTADQIDSGGHTLSAKALAPYRGLR